MRASVLFKVDDISILVDTGPDLRNQLLKSSINSVNAVLYTHEHQDHTAGLDDLRPLIFRQGKSMPLYCSIDVESRLRKQYDYIFNNADYPGVPKVNFFELKGDKAIIENIEITLIHALHGSLPVLGFRIGDISYLTDANSISDKELKKVKGSKYFIINALRDEPHYSHFHLEEAINVGRKSGAEEVLFTHISHHFEPHKELVQRLPEGFGVLVDGQTLRA